MARLPSRLHQSCGAVNRAANADVGSATANIGEIGIDIDVSWFWMFFQESNRSHDLSGLAVTTLRHILGQPSLLNGVLRVRRKTFYRRNALVGHIADLNAAGANAPPVPVISAAAPSRH